MEHMLLKRIFDELLTLNKLVLQHNWRFYNPDTIRGNSNKLRFDTLILEIESQLNEPPIELDADQIDFLIDALDDFKNQSKNQPQTDNLDDDLHIANRFQFEESERIIVILNKIRSQL